MDFSLSYIVQEAAGNPMLMITMLLTLGVIFVNGWTDAPNAIATCVTTRCLKPRTAILMSAAFNFLGVFIMTQINSAVASTISNMVDFGENTQHATVALCAALLSIVVYSVTASVFGIPTSESHSLIAGLSGAAIAIQQGIGGINGSEWVKVLYGLVLSLVLGFATGWIVCKLITIICQNVDRRVSNRYFGYAQIAGAAAMSFMHGAQDGQKFIGVLFLGVAFANGQNSVSGMEIPVWLMLLCSIVMGLGTSVGGEKIIKSVGMDMVKLERYQGFAADLAGALCLLYSAFLNSCIYHTYQNQCHYGRGSGKTNFSHQFRCCEGYDADLDFHVSGLRSDQLCYG